jgi:glutaredoxin-like protein NrdH
VKEFLSQAGYTYVARDVDEDAAAYRELVALGFRSVPVTVIGEQRIKGFDVAALRAALSAYGER